MVVRKFGDVPPTSIGDGVRVGTVENGGTTITDGGLNQESDYSYALFSYDLDGNTSAATDTFVRTGQE